MGMRESYHPPRHAEKKHAAPPEAQRVHDHVTQHGILCDDVNRAAISLRRTPSRAPSASRP
eukprot:scaffold3196_cov153-Pinguiococcus_pyrenoidosus.AAC.3